MPLRSYVCTLACQATDFLEETWGVVAVDGRSHAQRLIPLPDGTGKHISAQHAAALVAHLSQANVSVAVQVFRGNQTTTLCVCIAVGIMHSMRDFQHLAELIIAMSSRELYVQPSQPPAASVQKKIVPRKLSLRTESYWASLDLSVRRSASKKAQSDPRPKLVAAAVEALKAAHASIVCTTICAASRGGVEGLTSSMAQILSDSSLTLPSSAEITCQLLPLYAAAALAVQQNDQMAERTMHMEVAQFRQQYTESVDSDYALSEQSEPTLRESSTREQSLELAVCAVAAELRARKVVAALRLQQLYPASSSAEIQTVAAQISRTLMRDQCVFDALWSLCNIHSNTNSKPLGVIFDDAFSKGSVSVDVYSALNLRLLLFESRPSTTSTHSSRSSVPPSPLKRIATRVRSATLGRFKETKPAKGLARSLPQQVQAVTHPRVELRKGTRVFHAERGAGTVVEADERAESWRTLANWRLEQRDLPQELAAVSIRSVLRFIRMQYVETVCLLPADLLRSIDDQLTGSAQQA